MIRRSRGLAGALALVLAVSATAVVRTADHNDPNAINSIFSDIRPDGADLYDLFGFPASGSGDRVVIALTFGAMPATGVLDPDLLYRVLVSPAPRIAPPSAGDLDGLLDYFDAVKTKYLGLKSMEVRVRVNREGRAKVDLIDFPGGAISTVIDTNKSATLTAPDGSMINAYVGGRDDAFFNDLPGFFRSINYAPQFYHVPLAKKDTRELPIPKTLLELEGNTLFNFNPANPQHGQGVKTELPAGPYALSGRPFRKDANGNFRFVYSGRDAQAGMNVNAIIMELPLAYLTKTPQTDRIVNTWGETWVLKASGKIKAIPDDGAKVQAAAPSGPREPGDEALLAAGVGFILLGIGFGAAAWRRRPGVPGAQMARPAIALATSLALLATGAACALRSKVRPGQQGEIERASMADELKLYKLVDTDGQPFADAALNEREDGRQVGAYNFTFGRSFVRRLAHLGWGFAPSITALGLKTSFDHDNSPVSIHRTSTGVAESFLRVKKALFQPMNMPDRSWNPRGLNIPPRRAFEVFVPNVCAIDMDTTGSWPYGRRLEDQVATRFLALFLDMDAEFGGQKYNLETLQNQAALKTLPMDPKVPPNPLENDKPFLTTFPYLAEPWATASR